MVKEIWLNIPVKDTERTKNFYEAIGFNLTSVRSGGDMLCFSVGEKKMAVLFVTEELFKEFSRFGVSDANAASEFLISFDAGSREEVDETARRVFEAGGTIFGPPSEIQGWMYGFGFCDPDGHRWNQVFMDFSKLPQN